MNPDEATRNRIFTDLFLRGATPDVDDDNARCDRLTQVGQECATKALDLIKQITEDMKGDARDKALVLMIGVISLYHLTREALRKLPVGSQPRFAWDGLDKIFAAGADEGDDK